MGGVRDGPFVVDGECTSVHVGLSPCRLHLDVGMYQRIMRAVHMWFFWVRAKVGLPLLLSVKASRIQYLL